MASASQDKQKKESKSEKDGDAPSFDMKELQDLADLIEERGFTDFEFENEKIRVRMSKASIQPVAPPVPLSIPIAASQTETPSDVKEEEIEVDDGLHKITSPIVGTFYRSPGPDKDPFAKEGDMVSADSVVCIVEAMKLMNEIQAEASGEIVKIYVENGQPVEYGQELFGIK